MTISEVRSPIERRRKRTLVQAIVGAAPNRADPSGRRRRKGPQDLAALARCMCPAGSDYRRGRRPHANEPCLRHSISSRCHAPHVEAAASQRCQRLRPPTLQKWEEHGRAYPVLLHQRFFQPTRGHPDVAIGLRNSPTTGMPQASDARVDSGPVVRAVQASRPSRWVNGRQQGLSVVGLGTGCEARRHHRRARCKSTHLSELAPPLANSHGRLPFFTRRSFDLLLSWKSCWPQVEVEELVEVYVEPNQITGRSLAILNVAAGGGISQIELDVPEDTYSHRAGAAAAGRARSAWIRTIWKTLNMCQDPLSPM